MIDKLLLVTIFNIKVVKVVGTKHLLRDVGSRRYMKNYHTSVFHISVCRISVCRISVRHISICRKAYVVYACVIQADVIQADVSAVHFRSLFSVLR